MHAQDKKGFSDLDIKKSVLAKNAFSRPKAGKKAKKKFKRSLTMTTLPLQAFFAKAAAAANSVAANENKADKNTLSVQSNGKKYTNNNSEQNVTKFTIGTSDEEESNDEDNFLTVRYKCVLAYIFPALKLRIKQPFVITLIFDI